MLHLRRAFGLVVAAWLLSGSLLPQAQGQRLLPGSGGGAEWNFLEAQALRVLQSDTNPRRRLQAIEQLGRSQNPQLIPILAELAAYDRDELIRTAAFRSMQQIRDSSDRWDHRPPELGQFREDNLVASEFVNDPRKLAEVRDALRSLRSDRQAFRRENAARTLGRIGGPGVIPPLAHTLAFDVDREVQRVAGQAIERIQRRESRLAVRPVPPILDPGLPVDPWAEIIDFANNHYLGRAARPEEIRNWGRHFRQGGTYEQMLCVFVGSQEYWQRAGEDPRQLIVRLYVDCLQRQPNLQEVQIWIGHWRRLRGDSGDRSLFVRLFVETASVERRQKGIRY